METVDHFLRNLELNLDNYTLNNFKELYTITSMLTQKYLYILRDLKQELTLPYKLEFLLLESSKKIGICPILTHTSLDVYNWVYEGDFQHDLKTETVDTIYSKIDSKYKFFKGEKGLYEKGFTIPMVIIEAYGGVILNQLDKLLTSEEIRQEDLLEFFDIFLEKLHYLLFFQIV